MRETFGRKLHGLRRQREFSLRRLSKVVNYSHVYLWQVENGEKPPTKELARRCDRALDAGGELVALAEDQRAEKDRPSAPAAVDPSAVEVISAARERLEVAYRSAGGLAVRPRIEDLLRTYAAPLLEGSFDAELGRALYRAVAALTAFAGVCAYDCMDRAAADRHYQRALWLARGAGDRALAGQVLLLLARSAIRGGEPSAADEHLAGARARASSYSPALLADLHHVQAEAGAHARDTAAVMQHITAARDQIERIEPGAEPAEMRYLAPSLVEARCAEPLRSAGELAEATRYAMGTILLGQRRHPRGLANQLVVLANVLLASGAPDAAAARGLELLRAVAGMESRLMRWRVGELRAQLSAPTTDGSGSVGAPALSRDPVIEEFCARADGLLHSPL